MIPPRLAPVLLALAAAVWSRDTRAQVRQDTLPVDVGGPTVVVFSAPIGHKAVDADEDFAVQLDDLAWYLALATRALEKAGVAVDVRFARRVRLRGAGPKRELVPGGEHGGTGYLLVSPGRAPKLVRGGVNDVDLQRAAAAYFDRPEIAPGEGKRDG